MTNQLPVKVTPRAARSGIGSWRPASNGREELEIKVTEAPNDGAANEAVVKLLSRALGISRAEVRIISGAASRHKRLSIPFDVDEARRRLSGKSLDGS